MNPISKSSALVLILMLAVSSLMMVEPAFGAIKPAVPEFTVRFVDLSYYVPPTYGTDQYTGQTVITQDGYHVDNRSLQFTITNQPFTPYIDSSGNQIGLYYNFRIKGAYGTEWDYYPFAPNGLTTRRYGGMFGGNSTESPADLAQSNSEYSAITIQIPGVYRVPERAQLEVQAQALIGYMVPSDYMLAGHVYVFTGQSSDWSNTQTITIGETASISTPSASPSLATPNPTALPTATPEQPSNPTGIAFGFSWEQTAIIVLIVLVAALLVVVGLLWRKISAK